MEYFFELFLSGLTRGSIYALIALGYTMVYGIIQLINFAHGEIYMIGAFTALIVASILTLLGLNQIAIIVIAALIAVVYSSAYGYTIEKIAYKPLRHAPRLSALISAIGMSLFLQNYVLLAQTSDFLPFPSLIPEFEFIKPYAHIIRTSEIIIFATTALVMVGLTFLIKFTKIGKAMRATSQDRDMAMLVGVDVNRVISVTFIIGSATAALGGVLIASHIARLIFILGLSPGSKRSWRPCLAESAVSPVPCSEVSCSDGRKPFLQVMFRVTMKTCLPSCSSYSFSYSGRPVSWVGLRLKKYNTIAEI